MLASEYVNHRFETRQWIPTDWLHGIFVVTFMCNVNTNQLSLKLENKVTHPN